MAAAAALTLKNNAASNVTFDVYSVSRIASNGSKVGQRQFLGRPVLSFLGSSRRTSRRVFIALEAN